MAIEDSIAALTERAVRAEERVTEAVQALSACARDAQAARLRLRSLAFNPDDDVVLRCEEIEGRAFGVIGGWHRRDAEGSC